MTDETRVEALPFGNHYFAVLRRPGEPDDIIDDTDGKPKRFDTAYAAIRAGKALLAPEAKTLEISSKTFRHDRNRDLDEERDRVFSRLGGGR